MRSGNDIEDNLNQFSLCKNLASWRLGGLKIWLLMPLLLTACFGSQPPAPYSHYGVTGGADSAGVHTVRGGDTVWNVAQRYRLSMQDVIHVNKLRPPYVMDVGQRLTLPPPTTYTVRGGDTLYGVSRTFNVSVTQLARQNSLQSPYRINTGDTLRMPSLAGQRSGGGAQNYDTALVTPSTKPSGGVQKKTVNPRVTQAVSKRTPARAGGKFAWPVQGKVLSSYGPKKGGLHNDGINISSPKGTPIRAAENGVVVYAGSELEGYGNLVLVRHADRWMTAYAHMDKTLIKKGQEIRKGQSLGTVGSSGNVSRPQLHFEIRRGTEALNPRVYLARG